MLHRMEETTIPRAKEKPPEEPFELLRHLGESGQAALYLARDKRRGALVVLKTGYPRIKDSPEALRALSAELSEEARLLALTLPGGAFAQFNPGRPGELPYLAITLNPLATPAQLAAVKDPATVVDPPRGEQREENATVAYARPQEEPRPVYTPPAPEKREVEGFSSKKLLVSLAAGVVLAGFFFGAYGGIQERPAPEEGAPASMESAAKEEQPPVPGLPGKSATSPIAPVGGLPESPRREAAKAPEAKKTGSPYASYSRDALLREIARRMTSGDYKTAEAMVDELLARDVDDEDARFYKTWLDGTH